MLQTALRLTRNIKKERFCTLMTFDETHLYRIIVGGNQRCIVVDIRQIDKGESFYVCAYPYPACWRETFVDEGKRTVNNFFSFYSKSKKEVSNEIKEKLSAMMRFI